MLFGHLWVHNKMKIYKSTASLILVLAFAVAQGQDKENKFFNDFNLSAGGGSSWMLGDLVEHYSIPNPTDWNKTLSGSFRVSISKWLMDDLGLRLKYQYGQLIGGRQPGPQSEHVTFETQFHDVSLMGKYSITGLFGDKDPLQRRWYADFELGVGVIFWRSFSIWTRTNGIKDYVGYEERPESFHLAQKNLLEKADMVNAMIMPVGFNIGYRLNYKTDINAEATVTNTFTDDLDTWNRGWTALDKYAYFGLGLTYNFNRTIDDYPPKRKKKKKKKNSSSDASGSVDGAAVPAGMDVSDINSGGKGGGSKKSRRHSREDDMLEIQLKMYEMQLKLFEMQYLLNR